MKIGLGFIGGLVAANLGAKALIITGGSAGAALYMATGLMKTALVPFWVEEE